MVQLQGKDQPYTSLVGSAGSNPAWTSRPPSGRVLGPVRFSARGLVLFSNQNLRLTMIAQDVPNLEFIITTQTISMASPKLKNLYFCLMAWA